MVNSLIENFIDWFMKHPTNQPRHINRGMLQLNSVKQFCKSFSNCEDVNGEKCPFKEKNNDCAFRNKTPKE